MAHANGSTSSTTSHTISLPSTTGVMSGASTATATATSAAAHALLLALRPENRHAFVAPRREICDAALAVAKSTLDAFAAELCDEQARRVEAVRKERKRKRGAVREAGEGEGELLKIRKVHTMGFAVEQVWEQARRVIEGLKQDAERGVEELQVEGEEEGGEEEVGKGLDLVRFDEDGFEVGSGDESLGEEEEEEEGEEGEEIDGEMEEDELEGEEFEEEDGMNIDGLEGEDDYDEDEKDVDDDEAPELVEDPNGLNDGFFSIDEFNKQTEFLEQQDAKADPYTGEASDEEEIDWDMDPMTIPANAVSSSKRAKAMDVEDEDEESDDEDGPTFGNADLNAPEGDSGEDDDEDMDVDDDPKGDNTNDILYKDFFAPPARKITKGERQAQYLSRQEKKQRSAPEDEGNDIERAMADVRRDLFDDESENDSEEPLSDADPGDPKSRKSAHERRQAKLAEEIRRLEAASVQKREWTLSGEARAADRPINSLLEEDLDFERTGKPVPVITAEVSESIEELIKRRIIAQEFDEVIRRRPDSESAPVRRGAFELDDSKAQQSLAEMYEEDHIKATNPDTYMSKTDEKLKKQHAEIEGLWKEVSAKLDALSSWHYKPKPPAPSLTVVSDVATVTMEDAQPTMASGMTGADSMLAPQEIYKAGKEKDSVEKGELVLKSGAPIARQEMTREEKLRRRRREKERIKKRGGEELGKPQSKKSKEKKETVDELKRAGVKVIGKRGEIRDVEGNKVKAISAANGAVGFKL